MMVLKRLLTDGIGPCKTMDIAFAERVNLITGDNSAGKTLVLDIIFESLTGQKPKIKAPFVLTIEGKSAKQAKRKTGSWQLETDSDCGEQHTLQYEVPADPKCSIFGAVKKPHYVLYFKPDGSVQFIDHFSNIYDNHSKKYHHFKQHHYSINELLYGKDLQQNDEPINEKLLNGLATDYFVWRQFFVEKHKLLEEALATFTRNMKEKGFKFNSNLISMEGQNQKPYPVFNTAYEKEIPLHLASSAYKKLFSWAYILIEYMENPTRRALAVEHFGAESLDLVILIDEVETHLHPQWQRTFLNALVEVTKKRFNNRKDASVPNLNVQIIATTHAPLVCAGAQDFWDTKQDKLWVFELDKETKTKCIKLEEQPWEKFGEASSWLESPVFGLKSGRSVKTEDFVQKLETHPPTTLEAMEALEATLVDLFDPDDPIFVNWQIMKERLRQREQKGN
jgi:AAA15 family ATPase/GTPase